MAQRSLIALRGPLVEVERVANPRRRGIRSTVQSITVRGSDAAGQSALLARAVPAAEFLDLLVGVGDRGAGARRGTAVLERERTCARLGERPRRRDDRKSEQELLHFVHRLVGEKSQISPPNSGKQRAERGRTSIFRCMRQIRNA